MSNDRIRTFEEFWPVYVREHAQKATRTLHVVGTTAAMACAVGAMLTKKRSLYALALVVGYGPAWIGHALVERNRPTSFEYPLWSLAADLKMWSLTLSGRMDAEVERIMAPQERRAPEDDQGVGRVDISAPKIPREDLN